LHLRLNLLPQLEPDAVAYAEKTRHEAEAEEAAATEEFIAAGALTAFGGDTPNVRVGLRNRILQELPVKQG
jgi:hypothetical protein